MVAGIFNSRAAAAIPWAWALNGFFTVLGGYLAIVISINSSFIAVLLLSLAIYAVALLVVRKSVNLENSDHALSDSPSTINAI